jgi:hypothetical protein
MLTTEMQVTSAITVPLSLAFGAVAPTDYFAAATADFLVTVVTF